MIRAIPPDGAAWSLGVEASPGGVSVGLSIVDVDGKPITIWLAVDRADARAFARSILRCAGDATERTFPHPQESGDGR